MEEFSNSKTPNYFYPERLRKVIRDTEGKYARRDQNFRVYENWYFKEHGEFPTSLEANTDEAITPNNLPTHMINMATAMLMQETPSIKVHGGDDTKKTPRERAELSEKVFMGTLYANSEEQEKELLALYFHNLLLYGWGVTYTAWDPVRVPPSLKSDTQKAAEKTLRGPASEDALTVEDDEDEEEAERDFPIFVDVPHPKEVYAIDGGHRSRWKAQFRRMTSRLADVEDHYGVEFKERILDRTSADAQVDDDTEVQVYDFWAYIGRQVWHCIFVDGIPQWMVDDKGKLIQKEDQCLFVKEPAHMKEYARLPYDIRFCIPTSSTDPARYGLSILYTVIDAVAAAERLQSRHELTIDNFADPTMKAKYNTQESSSASPPQILKQPGEVIYLDEGQGQDVDILQWRGSPPDVFQMWERMYMLAKEFGFDAQIEGSTGLDSFVKKSGILAKLTLPIKAAESGLAATHARIIRLFVHMVKDRKLTVCGRLTVDSQTKAYSVRVKGTDLKGYDQATFTLHARFPFEELQNVTAAVQATQGDKPLISLHRARTQYMRIQDADAEAEKIAQEMAEDPGMYIPKLIELGFQQMQMQLEQQMMAMQQQMMMGQQQGMMPQSPMAGMDASNPQGLMASLDQMSAGLTQGAIPDQQMGLVDLGGQPLRTGNQPGVPPPTAPNDIMQNPGRGRPVG